MRQKAICTRGTAILAVLLFAAILSLTAGTSMAYFTTYTTAKGGQTIELYNTSTEIHEEFGNWVKTVQVENTGNVPCFVRIKALAGSQIQLAVSGEGWSSGNDGYWYYSEPVSPGAMTGSIRVQITTPQTKNSTFNVTVVQECVPVSYRQDGTPYADWAARREAVT